MLGRRWIAPDEEFPGIPRTRTATPDAIMVPRLRLVERPEAEIDSALRDLSRHEARCRLSLGVLAAAFRRIEGHHRLGFARLGDFTRERLGLSQREIQGLASVAARLEELPSISLAFERGELSWSQVRIVTAIARPESEEEWLTGSRGRTVRALVEQIRRERSVTVTSERLREALDEESGLIEGEASVRFRLRCPSRIVSLWHRTIELARRMLGAQAEPWKAAEAIAAEGMSSVPAGGGSVELEAAAARPSGQNGYEEEMAGPGVTGAPAASTEPATLSEAFPHVDWFATAEVSDGLEAALPRAIEDLDAFELDERMRAVVRSMQGIDSQMGKLLRRLLDSRLYRMLGFDSFDRYVRERLGMSSSRARALIVIERRSKDAPGLSAAYATGGLSWVRALTILPVVAGPHEREWITRAGEVTVRRLSDEVEWAMEVRDMGGAAASVAPPDPSAPLVFPDLQMCARPAVEVADREVTFCGPASVVGLFRAAVAAFTEPNEPAWRGLERLLLQAMAEWRSQPRHRDPIFERDGWRCAVPACSSRKNLHDHHYVYRSRGGNNERDNRGVICAAHHLRGIHGGLVRASGRAPDDIIWELGLRPGRAALLVFRGDRYVA